jgi:PPP family 3-phenylpropionic acid transporter
MKKIWPFTFYFVYFAGMSGLFPFFVLFYQGLGFSGAQIGLLTGIPPLVTLVASPFWTGVADSRRWHRWIMALGIGVSAVVVFLLQSFTSFAIIFMLIILFNFFFSPVPSLADSATIHMLGEERAMYGRIRLGGTLGWGLFAPIAGALVENYGLRIGFWMCSGLMLVNLLISQNFVHGSHEQAESRQGGIRILLANRRWLNFLFLAFLGGIGSFSAAAYLFPYMAELGASEATMGIGLTLSTLTEIPIFFFGHRLVRKFGSYGLLIVALIMMGVRSLLFAAANTASLVLTVQGLGGMLFPAMWLAGVSYADENAPAGLKSSAQGLLGAMSFGVGAAFSGFISGLLLESIGGRGLFFVLGLVILVGLAIAAGVRRLSPDQGPLPEVIPVSSDK